MGEFLAMGGHGLYVWLAYGISFVVLTALGLRPIIARRQFIANARRGAGRGEGWGEEASGEKGGEALGEGLGEALGEEAREALGEEGGKA